MRILQIAPQVPFPQSDGGKVGIFNITKYLALRGHHITLLVLDVHQPDDVRPLLEYCDLIRVPHSNKNSVPRAIGNLFSDIPYNISKYRSRDLELRLKEVLSRGQFDVVHVDHLHMAHFGLLCRDIAGIPIVLREHNVESVIMQRYLAVTRASFFRQWLSIQMQRIQRYEAEMASAVDACCMITKQDEAVLKRLQPRAHTFVIPAGVEGRLFEEARTANPVPFSLALVGDFEWGPNIDALHWFMENIFPKILDKRPEATVYLIGKNVPPAIKREGRRNVVVRGLVPDFKEELRQYEMLVVPLRVGGGIRLKILESFAMGVPVVSTSVGCEGIEAEHDEHLLIADTEEAFAGQVVRLFGDLELKEKLRNKARSLVVRRHRWEDIGEAFEKVYEEVVGRGHGGAKKVRTQ